MKTAIASCVALAALALHTSVWAQQAGDAEELPVPEEKSVLVQPEGQLEPPPLLAPPQVPADRDDASQTPQPKQIAPLPTPPGGGPTTSDRRPVGPRLMAPTAPNLGAPEFGAPVVGSQELGVPGGFVLPPTDRGDGPVLVNPGVQIVPQAAPVGIAGRPAQVRIKDGEKRFPGGVPTTVKVYAPHNPKREALGLASPQFVEVWVPPFAPKEVKRNRDGSEIKLDFGEYEVEVHFRRDGRIDVDYDD